MLTSLRRKLRLKFRAPADDRSSQRDQRSERASDRAVLLELLSRAAKEGRVYQVRDLHGQTGMRQTRVLRSISDLEDRGLVSLHGGEFDPFSALVRLTDTGN